MKYKESLQRSIKKRMVPTILIGIGVYLFSIFLLVPLYALFAREHWAQAFNQTAVIKDVELTIYDHESEWKDNSHKTVYSNEIIGSSGHWLGNNRADVPRNKPSQLWYDGRLIATEAEILNPTLSPDGLHYAYIRSQDYTYKSKASKKELIIDGQVYVSGEEFHILRLPNDIQDIYYNCKKCNFSNESLFKGHNKLLTYDGNVTSDRVKDLFKYECLSDPDADISGVLTKLGESDAVEYSCSPNGKYILSIYLKDRFPEGNWDISKG
jgi:hypothetical protein